MLCQKCKKQTATVHLTDLMMGEKRERHLCEQCAGQEGITIKQQVSITEVLSGFLATQNSAAELARLRCPDCGTTFAEFRNQGLLGCPNDYDVFGAALAAVIERAQDSNTQHTGRSPGQAPPPDNRADRRRLELHRELREAVEHEEYERAAKIRDELNSLESQAEV